MIGIRHVPMVSMNTTRHTPALGKARVMQPTTAALGIAPQAPRGFKLATFRLEVKRDTVHCSVNQLHLICCETTGYSVKETHHS